MQKTAHELLLIFPKNEDEILNINFCFCGLVLTYFKHWFYSIPYLKGNCKDFTQHSLFKGFENCACICEWSGKKPFVALEEASWVKSDKWPKGISLGSTSVKAALKKKEKKLIKCLSCIVGNLHNRQVLIWERRERDREKLGNHHI